MRMVACGGRQVEAGVKEIQILPRGWVKSTQGDFLVDDQAVAELLTAFNARKNDLVLDYEHQTLTGAEAPAAGWIVALHDRGPDGVWATVEWTDKAMQRIAAREYRYFSPVVLIRKKDRRAVQLHSGALTNDPAIDGMVPIAAKSRLWTIINKEATTMENLEATETTTETTAENALLASLRTLLELPEDATEEQVIEAVQALLAKPEVEVAHEEILEELGVNKKATLAQVKGAIIALKRPDGHVSKAEYLALKKRLDERDRDDLVTAAMKAGKITPAQKEWAEEYALKDPQGFRAFIEHAPAVVPMEEVVTDPLVTQKRDVAVDDETQLAVNRQLGIDPERWKKFASKDK